MALSVTLAQTAGTNQDTISLKAISIDYPIRRSPIVILLPNASYTFIDLNRSKQNISISVVVDQEVTELFVDNKAGPAFQAGEVITGNAAWDAGVSPARAVTPTANIVSALPNLTAPTTLFIRNLGFGNDDFFINNEQITGGTSTGTALVNQPIPSFHRIEQFTNTVQQTGNFTLVTPNASYTVRIENVSLNHESGREAIYTGRLDFVRVA